MWGKTKRDLHWTNQFVLFQKNTFSCIQMTYEYSLLLSLKHATYSSLWIHLCTGLDGIDSATSQILQYFHKICYFYFLIHIYLELNICICFLVSTQSLLSFYSNNQTEIPKHQFHLIYLFSICFHILDF